MMDNSMAAGPQPSPTGAAVPPVDPLAGLSAAHDSAKAQFGKVSSVGKLIDATRRELDKLVDLGDSIDQEDVIKGTAALVGAGADPQAMMAMLANPTSPMPEGGAALAGWIQQQDAVVKQREAQFNQAQAVSQHQLGVSALRLIAGHHIMAQGQSAASPAAPPPDSTPPSPSANPMGA